MLPQLDNVREPAGRAAVDGLVKRASTSEQPASSMPVRVIQHLPQHTCRCMPKRMGLPLVTDPADPLAAQRRPAGSVQRTMRSQARSKAAPARRCSSVLSRRTSAAPRLAAHTVVSNQKAFNLDHKTRSCMMHCGCRPTEPVQMETDHKENQAGIQGALHDKSLFSAPHFVANDLQCSAGGYCCLPCDSGVFIEIGKLITDVSGKLQLRSWLYPLGLHHANPRSCRQALHA